jgi:hypothetical protein
MTRKRSLYLSVAATCLPAALSDPAACRIQGPNQKERHQGRGDEPERAGIMSGVIAETHNRPSRYANAAVIDDQGRYSCPTCRRPNIKYTVWVRGEVMHIGRERVRPSQSARARMIGSTRVSATPYRFVATATQCPITRVCAKRWSSIAHLST